ncbi:MAG: hypothetical protein LLG20_01845 [Acidobacteriales bacterium]|nr:hypothetical protein [Terriglobales bacterium]
MITLEQILDKMAEVLLANVALRTWIEENCQRELTIQIGEDGANPAGAEDCPIVILTPWPRGTELGEDISERQYRVEIDWLLHDDRIDTRTHNLKVYQGVYAADQLGQLVYAALLEFSNSVTISKADYGIDAVLTWPLIAGGMTVFVNVPNLIGAEVTL